ncbi:MAG: PBP1A family penicillin-binding protein [Calditrichaeota bacterium]|nr:PBP1A family penicillin-binding protein [Calditrichota bacterium]
MLRIWSKLGRDDFTRALIAGMLILLAGLAFIMVVIFLFSFDLPNPAELKGYEPRLATRILDRRGEVLTELFAQRRILTPLDQIPQHFVDAVLTTEDARFYLHWGVDIARVMKAAFIDLTSLSLKQGASTITQQLARDIYLHKERTFGRKIRETLTAIQLERYYSKREILEMYLTQIYFGNGAYGVAAAAERYFNKKPSELTLAEAATLTGLPKAPGLYSPTANPDRCIQRRNLILYLMLQAGKIKSEAYNLALAEPLNVHTNYTEDDLGAAPYFTEMIRQTLSREGERLGFDYLCDGLTVYSTLDARMQRFAEWAVAERLGPFQSDYRYRFVQKHQRAVSERLYGKGVLAPWVKIRSDSALVDSLFPTKAVVQVALVALDPKTGDILAFIGGRDFRRSKFNRVVQAVRQPGSVFKPFAYTAAIDNGYSPAFELLNQDVVLTMPDGTRWTPQNYDGTHGGPTTLREALKKSLNLVTVRLTQEVVPPQMVADYARQMGITTKIDPVDAVGLGASGMIPLETTAAFAIFADGGIHHRPRSIVKISDRFDEILAEYSVERRVALSAQTAYIMTDMLRGALNSGTGASARWLYGFTADAAGKTGTTNEFTDAWFIGFTPNLVCGVWVGLDDPAESLGPSQSGAVAALPTWARFMKMTYDSLYIPDEPFPIPQGIVRLKICQQTKLLATPYCPTTFEEIFRSDTKPVKRCSKHPGR